jgi:hypothetical protein
MAESFGQFGGFDPLTVQDPVSALLVFLAGMRHRLFARGNQDP